MSEPGPLTQSGEPPKPTPITVDDLHDQLRAWILTGELEAGAVASQVKLARRLGVGRTPLREALRMLQREGLVEAEYNRRVRISPLSTSDLESLYSMRITQEALAIRLSVPHFTPGDIQRLHDLLGEMDEFGEVGDFASWEVRHREFHRLLVAYAGRRLVSATAELSDHGERYRRVLARLEPMTLSVGAAEHAAIVTASEAKDAIAAGELMARHLARTALSLISISDPTHEPSQIREALRLVLRSPGAL